MVDVANVVVDSRFAWDIQCFTVQGQLEICFWFYADRTALAMSGAMDVFI